MRLLTPLQTLILANLYERKNPISRYEAMSSLNAVTSLISHPYSPGAVYHCIKGLAGENMITFNHKSLQISALGQEILVTHLTQSPPPSSILYTLYEILALQCISDSQLQRRGWQRLKIEMIKNNHYGDFSESLGKESSGLMSALKCCHQELWKSISRISIELSA